MYTIYRLISNNTNDIKLLSVAMILMSVLVLDTYIVALTGTLIKHIDETIEDTRHYSSRKFKGLKLNCITILNVTAYWSLTYMLVECYMFLVTKILGVTNICILLTVIPVASVLLAYLTQYGNKRFIDKLVENHKIKLGIETSTYTIATKNSR